ncbi:hypothetical protein [Sulfuricurvum sp.]|uniref:hypothetical protein n=1 Tax=Sulfuricurvum sp. TaxID=2025608 RepID=UPI00286D8179|nr:hypothetical protein [Sulfuricurvum sp.]
MIVASATQPGYIPATNKTTAINTSSAYESVTPTTTQQTDQKAEIQKKEEPTKATTEVQSETQEPIITAQQEIEIKQQVTQTMSETEESPLATAIQESSKESQATGKMAEMQEKYKDVYTPIPETYSKADEDLQIAKVKEAYPNYISGPELFELVNKIYTEELGGEPIRLGQAITQDQTDKQKQAWDKVNAMFGGEEALNKMIAGAQAIQIQYPINDWAKEGVSNAKELARFQNAAVYEGLESGKTVEEAKKYVGSIRDSYMDLSGMSDTFVEKLIKAGRIDPIAKQMDPDRFKPDFNSPINTTWDLRQYGIEGDWTKNNIYNNDKAMISELEKKVNQFNFMLNNENLIQQANSKLDPSDQNLAQASHYKEWINDQYLPEVQKALDIFKNYKIYDSIDVKG